MVPGTAGFECLLWPERVDRWAVTEAGLCDVVLQELVEVAQLGELADHEPGLSVQVGPHHPRDVRVTDGRQDLGFSFKTRPKNNKKYKYALYYLLTILGSSSILSR